MCHPRHYEPRLAPGGRRISPVVSYGPDGRPTSGPGGTRTVLTRAMIPRLSDEALAKLISQMQAASYLSSEQYAFLLALKSEQVFREQRIELAPVGSDVWQASQALLQDLAREQEWNESNTRQFYEWVQSLLDSTDDSTPTIPAKGYELVLEKLARLPAVPVEVVIKLLGGADPANSGGDVIPPTPLPPFKSAAPPSSFKTGYRLGL